MSVYSVLHRHAKLSKVLGLYIKALFLQETKKVPEKLEAPIVANSETD